MPLTALLMVTVSPDRFGSFAAVTVKPCAVFQLLAVKLRYAGETVTALVSLLVGVTVTVTPASGSAVSTAV